MAAVGRPGGPGGPTGPGSPGGPYRLKNIGTYLKLKVTKDLRILLVGKAVSTSGPTSPLIPRVPGGPIGPGAPLYPSFPEGPIGPGGPCFTHQNGHCKKCELKDLMFPFAWLRKRQKFKYSAFTLGPLGPTIPGAPCSPVVP